MANPIDPYSVPINVGVEPGLSTSDSINLIFPGMSISKRWIFRCVARSVPVGENVKEVL